MGDVQYRDGMIDIGDPTEDRPGPAPAEPPKVVIEYRERGIPWMLIPPLLVLSAVLAVLGVRWLEPPRPRDAPAAPVPPIARGPVAPESRPSAAPPAPVELPPPGPAVVLPNPPSGEPEPKAPPELDLTLPPAPVVGAQVVDVPGLVANPEPDPGVEPRPERPVEGVGFDPKAFAADASAPASGPMPAPADPSLAPVGTPAPGNLVAAGPAMAAPPGPGVGMGAADPDQPEEIDPDLLPPDPRLARARKADRIAAARQAVEAERAEFHAELRRICLRSGVRSGPAIDDLCERYPAAPDPAMMEQVGKLLGTTGRFVGASRSTRIGLLRSRGFSEAAILRDLIEHDGEHLLTDKGNGISRNGPRNQGEVAYHSALYLLGHPPTRPVAPDRLAPSPSTSGDDDGVGPDPKMPAASRSPGRPAARFGPIR